MTFGLAIYKADGSPLLAMDGSGGVYVGVVTQAVGVSSTVTFTGLVGLTLRPYQLGGGSHTWVVGTDGSGNPTISFTSTGLGALASTTSLMVFAA